MKSENNITWIPTIGNLMEDIMLMISINILRDKKLKEEFSSMQEGKKADIVELAQLDPDALQRMYKLNKQYLESHNNFKIAFSVFDWLHPGKPVAPA
ncbi:MAG: hypothetical protein U5N58_08620 [Actinomycetota bacterium]|nr:hypothetical protein [Actinomycetota bacterium]